MLLWTGHLCHCQLNGRDLVVYLKIEFWGGACGFLADGGRNIEQRTMFMDMGLNPSTYIFV